MLRPVQKVQKWRRIVLGIIALAVITQSSGGTFTPVQAVTRDEERLTNAHRIAIQGNEPITGQSLVSPNNGGTNLAQNNICELYPIALSAQTLQGKNSGDTINNILQGQNLGNFGWLSWNGANGVPDLVTSLTPPGNSNIYRNPDNNADTIITIGDWVRGRPGVSNSSNVRAALDILKTRDIVLPVWSAVRGAGANLAYQISAFAQVRLLDYRLPSANQITVRFLGYVNCAGSAATPTNTPIPYQPLRVCWVRHWNGTGSTEWQITNPNPVPISSTPDTKIKYNWTVYNQLNALGTVLQSAQNLDNGNPNPVNTVYAQSMKLEWFLVVNGAVGPILGTAIANANASGACNAAVTATSTPSRTSSATFTPSFTNTATNTYTQTPSNTLTLTPSQTSTNTNTPTFTPSNTPSFTNTATNTYTQTPSNTLTLTPSQTPTNTNTPTFTPSNTPSFTNTPTSTFTNTPSNTPSPSPTLPFNVQCLDFRVTSQGWVQSPWITSGTLVVWSVDGMFATGVDGNQAAAYFAFPTSAGNTYQVRFTTSGVGTFTVAQSDTIPDGANGTTLISRADGSFVATAPYIEVRWNIASGAPLRFETFCYAPFAPPTTPSITNTATNTPSATFTATSTPTPTQQVVNADLVALSVNAAQMIVDGQTLQASGTLSAVIANTGAQSATAPFVVTFFADRNGNGLYDSDVDSLLGVATQTGLSAGQSVTITAPINGSVLFPNNTVYAFVDSTNLVLETNESNNVAQVQAACVLPVTQAINAALEWQWTGSSVLPNSNQVMMTPLVIDLDQNGVPDIIFSTYSGVNYKNDGHLRAIRGDGSGEIFTITDPAYNVVGVANMAVADIDLDGLPEIIAVGENGVQLLAFENDGTFKWRSSVITVTSLWDSNWGGPSIADLNHDGTPEIVFGGNVLNNDGTIRWSGTGGQGDNNTGSLSLVADLDMQGDMEIVAGNTAYRSDGSIFWFNTSISGRTDGFNAVGNFDADLQPEVVLVSRGRLYLLDSNGTTIWGPVSIPGSDVAGPPTIADVDNDGQPEIGVAGASKYTVFETDGTIKWSANTQDFSSQTTGSSVFDFDGDGAAEVVYGDEAFLSIFRGTDGTVLWQQNSSSLTGYELPVIADVDGDGQAEIIKAANNGNNGIQVFGSQPGSGRWVATRAIWNQHTYHITNINDDGSVPRNEAYSWLQGNTYRLNTFPAPRCLSNLPDFNASYVRTQRDGATVQVTVRIANIGGVVAPANAPVSLYDGDPRSGGLLLGTARTTAPISVSGFADVTLSIPYAPTTQTLWVSADDTGALIGEVTESDEGNNLYNSQISVIIQTITPTPSISATPTATATVTLTPSPTLPGNLPPITTQGCIGAPLNRATVSNTVPIVLCNTTNLTNAAVDVWPEDNPNAYLTLVSGITAAPGSTLANFDTTTIANGPWVVRIRGTNSAGQLVNDAVLLNVIGENKPGRVTLSTVDLVVPVTGLPIVVERSYDSLERDRIGDFGHGWKLSLGNPRLTVNAANDVTLTMPDGKRVTFYFAPTELGFGFSLPGYQAEPGVYGSLTSDTCLLVLSGGQFFCFPGSRYAPVGYTYTDPYGRKYALEASGRLKSITDLDGNILTFSLNGITSSDGLNVPFIRDAQGRITQITDPLGKVYTYNYDGSGDLVSVTLPDTPQPVSYGYDSAHLLTRITDPRGNRASFHDYYPDGRLKSVTDALNQTTSYAYDLLANTTTITQPDGGIMVMSYNMRGYLMAQRDALDRVTTFAYDANDNLLTSVNPAGEITTYTYDVRGNRTSVTDGEGNTSTASYNQYGSPATLTDPLGTPWVMVYDGRFRPTGVTDALGSVGGFTWDDKGNPLTRIDANGAAMTYTYDIYGKVLTETDALGQTTTYTYDLLGRRLTSTDARGNTTTYTYDGLGRMLSATDSLNGVTTYSYDANGNNIQTTDPLGRVTLYTYDALNRLTLTTYPDGTTTAATYDWRGNMLTETDQRGNVTAYVYDLAGQLNRVTVANGTPDAAITLYVYDAAGRRIGMTDPRGFSTTYTYDRAGRMLTTTDALTFVTTYTYDAAGRVTTMRDGNGRITSYTYDIRGRRTSTLYPDGSTSAVSYDSMGRMLTSTDQGGKVTTRVYDAIGQLKSVANPMNQVTAYSYDAVGNLLAVTDANGHTTGFAYDALNRMTTKTWPDATFEAMTYDAVGNSLTQRLADGNVNAFIYDSLNRLTTAVYFDGRTETFTYSPTGQRATATDMRGLTSYTYDAQDRLTRIAVPSGAALNYAYDASSNRIAFVTPTDSIIYSYDAVGQLIGVQNNGAPVGTMAYDAVGLRTRLTRGNGVVTDYSYDALNRLTNITHQRGATVLAAYTYTLDPVGNRTGLTEADGSTTTWTYDAAYRLLSETRAGSPTISGAPSWTLAWTYDAVGNRLTQTENGTTTAYSYNINDQLLAAGSTTYTYDPRGNLIGTTTGLQTTTYTWDAQDRMTMVASATGTTAAYTYDTDGRRVRATDNGITTHYLWDEASPYGDVVLESDAANTPITSYVLADAELLSRTQNGMQAYYLADGQGSTRALADSAGSLTDSYLYDAFGTTRAAQGTSANKYLYTGQQQDAGTGLYSLRARYYSPGVGRFLSRDTWTVDTDNPVELMRYGYVAGNPVNASDPSGLFATQEYSRINSENVKTATGFEAFKNAYYFSQFVAAYYRAKQREALLNIGLWFLGRIIIELLDTAPKSDPQIRPTPKPTPDPEPTRQPPPDRTDRQEGNCPPGLRKCSDLPSMYKYASKNEAFNAAKAEHPNVILTLRNPDPTYKHCKGNENDPKEFWGTHYNIRKGSERYGSIIVCPCCDYNGKQTKRCALFRRWE
jgi:RHS repeat-associated protein